MGHALGWESVLARPPVALSAYVAAWTLASALTHPSLHHDMLEAWVWGQHPALGYFKHPPFSALLPGIWFRILPRLDWTFYLLAYANAAAGLWAVWLVAGRLLPESTRGLSVLLLGLTPFFTFSVAKFNANTVLLSVWPWTVYLLIRSLDLRSAASGLALGIVAAVALLSKYYSVLLLGSCALASLLHPRAKEYWRSPAPYVAIVTFLLAISPHAAWLVRNDFQTFKYAEHTMSWQFGDIIGRATWAMISALLLHFPVVAAVGLVLGDERARCLARLRDKAADRSNWWLLVLAFGPYVLTYLACLVADVRISLQFMIPAFFLWPLTGLYLAGCDIPARGVRNIGRMLIAVALVGIAVAPFVAIVNLKLGYPTFAEPRQAVAAAATRVWRERFGKPLTIVAGEQGYAEAIVFYSADSPSELTGFDYGRAPWVTPEQVTSEGMLFVCPPDIGWCVEGARQFSGPSAQIVEQTFPVSVWGVSGKPRTVLFVLRPPSR